MLLQSVMLGYCTREQLRQNFEGHECAHCARHSHRPLMHYLFTCPATARMRPVPAATSKPAAGGLLSRREAKAALLVRHSPRDLLMQVLRAAPQPYCYDHCRPTDHITNVPP